MDATSGLMPLHKLSQWLAYSLIEPLQTAGIRITDIDGLTGLAEYRNGGLFVDIGVLGFRDAADAQRDHEVASSLVVEWRAPDGGVCSNRVADRPAATAWASTRLPYPWPKFSKAGHGPRAVCWARERRADASPPVKVISDGTVF
ncbi:MAG: DUF1688 family protein [Bradyrhizobium sp.]